MQINIKSIAEMSVKVVALKQIMVQGKITAAGAEFTMSLEEYEEVSGGNLKLAPGEADRIQAVIDAKRSEGKDSRKLERARQAAEVANRRLAIAETTAAANARNDDAVRRRDALEGLVDGALTEKGR